MVQYNGICCIQMFSNVFIHKFIQNCIQNKTLLAVFEKKFEKSQRLANFLVTFYIHLRKATFCSNPFGLHFLQDTEQKAAGYGEYLKPMHLKSALKFCETPKVSTYSKLCYAI